MSLYRIAFCGEMLVDAPNVAQAAKVARGYKVIGAAIGSQSGMKERDSIRYERYKVEKITLGPPRRVPTSTSGQREEK